MSDEKVYELKKDIWTPAFFIRAGFRKTEKEWKERLGDFEMKWASDWFFDPSEKAEQQQINELNELIEAVFMEKGLNSISYKEAAKEVAEIWLKQNKKA